MKVTHGCWRVRLTRQCMKAVVPAGVLPSDRPVSVEIQDDGPAGYGLYHYLAFTWEVDPRDAGPQDATPFEWSQRGAR